LLCGEVPFKVANFFSVSYHFYNNFHCQWFTNWYRLQFDVNIFFLYFHGLRNASDPLYASI
jgi:hypothetical protein